MDRVVLCGGSGLIGRRLGQELSSRGLAVQTVSRRPRSGGPFPEVDWAGLPQVFDGALAVVNLAGAGIGDGRWSAARKRVLVSSRVDTTRRIVAALGACASPPRVLVNASAVGFYGPRGNEIVDEQSAPGCGFLAETCQAWEAAAEGALPGGIRLVLPRIGPVLAREGGALPRMALPIRLFAGSAMGDARQGFPWIHAADLARMLAEMLLDQQWSGPVNVVAPGGVDQGGFTRALARRLHRPVWPVPGWISGGLLRLILGELAEEMILGGAFVQPGVAQERIFTWRFPTLDAALADLYPDRIQAAPEQSSP